MSVISMNASVLFWIFLLPVILIIAGRVVIAKVVPPEVRYGHMYQRAGSIIGWVMLALLLMWTAASPFLLN